ncbi:hypothetical protein AC1031_000712 [Aphanomyces cochlioides]|nr:hypothetical protein AC1031_000712 [Aphanomyces cochlioides]
MNKTVVTHSGACHCKRVKFEFDVEGDLVAFDCNCSICAMKRNIHTIVPKTAFRLLEGKIVCGVATHFIPRLNPEAVGVTIACITPGTLNKVDVQAYDGRNLLSTVS